MDSQVQLERFCSQFDVKFPCTFEKFWAEEVLAYLSDELEVQLTTTDVNLTRDYRPVLAAAAALKVAHLLSLGPNGLELAISPEVTRWRQHKQIRIAMETMIFCGVSVAQISEDFRTMYQTTFSQDDIAQFADVFFDVEYSTGAYWAAYAECIPKPEATHKLRLKQQPVDYVRHSLGVAVRLEPDQVLNRLMSDAYFTCMELKADNDGDLSKEDMVRVKFERDTIFKAMDRLTKHKEASGGNNSTKAADAIAKLALRYEDTNHKMLSELINDDANPA